MGTCDALYAALIALVLVPIATYILLLFQVHRKFAHFPRPKETGFFLGNIPSMAKLRHKGIDVDDIFLQWFSECNSDTFVVFFLLRVMVVTRDPIVIQHVMVQHASEHPKSVDFYKGIGFMFRTRGLGEGLVTMTDHAAWSYHRSKFNPAFSQKYLSGLIDPFNATADAMMTRLAQFVDKPEKVRLSDYLQHATLETIQEVAFSIKADASDTKSPFSEALFIMIASMSIFAWAIAPNWSPLLHDTRKKFKQSAKLVRDLAHSVVTERKKSIAKGQAIPEDILSFLVRASTDDPSITDDILVDNFVTFFLAGQETTATTLATTLMEIGRHPDVLNRVTAEVDEVLGSKSHISSEDLSRLSYLGAVLKEALRFSPVIGGTLRDFKKEELIGSLRFPAGTQLMVGLYGAARNDANFENAAEFNPARFEKPISSRGNAYAYMPFSLGPRNCIGQVFAQMEMKIIAAKFLQQFSYELDPMQSFEYKSEGARRPVSGVICRLFSRSSICQ